MSKCQRHTTSYFVKLPRCIKQQKIHLEARFCITAPETALEALVQARNIKNDTAQSFPTINFVKAGAKDTKCTKPVLTPSLLQGASDWKLLVDFDQDQVTFPPEFLSTNERPDIVFGRSKLEKLSLLSTLVLPKKGAVLLNTENKPVTCL